MKAEYGSFILRLAVGLIMLVQGISKVSNLEPVVGWFSSLGVPPIITYIVSFGELIGGVALILGLYTRLAALLLIPIMLGAVYFIMTGAIQGGIWYYPALVVAVCIVLYLQGSGVAALKRVPGLDALIPPIFKD